MVPLPESLERLADAAARLNDASDGLNSDIVDLEERLASMIVAYRRDKTPVYCRDIKAAGAMTVLLKDAMQPNLVQTLENTPAFVHGGPFANIAHGCNSVIATTTALKTADYVVTEAGFGADQPALPVETRAAALAISVPHRALDGHFQGAFLCCHARLRTEILRDVSQHVSESLNQGFKVFAVLFQFGQLGAVAGDAAG